MSLLLVVISQGISDPYVALLKYNAVLFVEKIVQKRNAIIPGSIGFGYKIKEHTNGDNHRKSKIVQSFLIFYFHQKIKKKKKQPDHAISCDWAEVRMVLGI